MPLPHSSRICSLARVTEKKFPPPLSGLPRLADSMYILHCCHVGAVVIPFLGRLCPVITKLVSPLLPLPTLLMRATLLRKKKYPLLTATRRLNFARGYLPWAPIF